MEIPTENVCGCVSEQTIDRKKREALAVVLCMIQPIGRIALEVRTGTSNGTVAPGTGNRSNTGCIIELESIACW